MNKRNVGPDMGRYVERANVWFYELVGVVASGRGGDGIAGLRRGLDVARSAGGSHGSAGGDHGGAGRNLVSLAAGRRLSGVDDGRGAGRDLVGLGRGRRGRLDRVGAGAGRAGRVAVLQAGGRLHGVGAAGRLARISTLGRGRRLDRVGAAGGLRGVRAGAARANGISLGGRLDGVGVGGRLNWVAGTAGNRGVTVGASWVVRCRDRRLGAVSRRSLNRIRAWRRSRAVRGLGVVGGLRWHHSHGNGLGVAVLGHNVGLRLVLGSDVDGHRGSRGTLGWLGANRVSKWLGTNRGFRWLGANRVFRWLGADRVFRWLRSDIGGGVDRGIVARRKVGRVER